MNVKRSFRCENETAGSRARQMRTRKRETSLRWAKRRGKESERERERESGGKNSRARDNYHSPRGGRICRGRAAPGVASSARRTPRPRSAEPAPTRPPGTISSRIRFVDPARTVALQKQTFALFPCHGLGKNQSERRTRNDGKVEERVSFFSSRIRRVTNFA